MSSSSEKIAIRGSEKASFSQKCSLLSQYLKENGSFGDLNLGITKTCSVEAKNGSAAGMNRPPAYPPAITMNLFPVNDASSTGSTSRNSKSMELFPQRTTSMEDARIIPDSSVIRPLVTVPETGQMTIFYGGQVIVFNDLPAHKAHEVMALASRGSSQSHVASHPNHAVFSPNIAKNPVEQTRVAPPPPSSSVVPNFVNNMVQPHDKTPSSSVVPNFVNNRVQPHDKTVVGDLPIARRASLHRFLEKRKDRINSHAPYLLNSPAASSSKQDGSTTPWFPF